jgi:hypothetical protein
LLEQEVWVVLLLAQLMGLVERVALRQVAI